MAKATEKKKRKNFVQRMMFGNENKPDLTPERMKMSKWAMFKYLFFSRFGTMVALNMLTALFALPAVGVIILFYLNITVSNGYIPYSANIGLGYPVVIDAIAQGDLVEFSYRLMEYLILIPCIAVFALGVAGNLYVMRKLVWEEPTSTFKDFFRGIRKCWLGAIFIGLVIGMTIVMFLFSLSYFDVYKQSVAVKALCITLSSILLVLIVLFSAFFLTQNAAFKMRPMALIRNSALFVFGTNVLSVIFVGIAISPSLLALIPNITIILAMIYVFIGFSFTTLVLTIYCHYCYERFLYDKIDASTVYAKRVNDIYDEKAKPQPKAKKQPTSYKNPKKRKKSIDEGTSLTPLTPMFRREDLERLQKEHETIIAESDDEPEELGELDDDTDTMLTVENAQDSAVKENNNISDGAANDASQDSAVSEAQTDKE